MDYNLQNILFVEDSELDFELMIRAIKKEGFECTPHFVSSLDDFKQTLKKIKPNIIVSDYNLEGFTGIEVIKTTDELKINIPIIIVSGNIGETKAVEALKHGATDYLLKNHINKLPHVIARSLNEWEIKKEKQAAIDALHQREQMYSRLLNTMKDGMIQIDAGFNILFANPSFVKMLGYKDSSSLIGKKLNTLYYNDLQSISKSNIELMHKNGDPVFCESSISSLEDDEHTSAVVFKDISNEIKQKQLTEELNRELDLLIYRIAHDLRGPICTIEGLLELVYPKLEENWSFLASNQIIVSYKILDKLTNLVQVKRHNVHLSKIKLTKFFDHIIEQNINTDFIISTNITDLVNDEKLLVQAMEPIIENAIQYHSGNNRLKILIDISKVKNKIIISIKDNGEGIPRDKLKNVMKIFYQGQNKYAGTGLGLYLSKIITEKLGGEISIDSVQKKYTEVKMELPMQNMNAK